MMNVYALVSKPQGRKDDENNYTIRMTDDGMMTVTFFVLLRWCETRVVFTISSVFFWLSLVDLNGTNF